MTRDEIDELLHAYMAATVAHDTGRIAGFLADDFALWMVPSVADHGLPNPIAGRESYLAFVRELSQRPAMWKPTGYEICDMFFGEDRAAIRVRLKGDYPSGAKYDCEYVFTFRFQGKLILEKREFVDTAYIASLNRKAAEYGPQDGDPAA